MSFRIIVFLLAATSIPVADAFRVQGEAKEEEGVKVAVTKATMTRSASWPQPVVLSATYGYKRCIGVSSSDMRSKDKLQSLGCTVVEHPDGTWETNAASHLIASLGICGGRAPMYMDGLPVTFNYPLLTKGMKVTDFLLTLSDGSQIFPSCFTMGPANEMNEMMTPLFTVDGVSSKGLEIVRFEVVGDVRLLRPDGEVLSARGLAYEGAKLRYQDTGPSLVWGSLSVFSAEREAKKGGALQTFLGGGSPYPNHCRVVFPGTTHVLKLAMDGGSTKDGITEVEAQDTHFFEVKLPDGQPFPVAGALLGLADLGGNGEKVDGDNFFDLCLKLEQADLAALQDQGSTLIAAATCREDTKLYYPKGDCSGACGDAACQRSEIQIELEVGLLANLETTDEEQTRNEAKWLVRFEELDGKTSGTDWPAPGDKFIDFGGGKVMDIDGEPHKCCCSSNVVNEPDESVKVICEIVKGTEGCKQLKGPGFHSWNNMGWKYKGLLNYGHCAVEE